MSGVKFRRQEQAGPYIVDFVCFNPRVVIEVDGGKHNEEANIEADRQRTQWLEGNRFTVLRFWNDEVLENIDGVVDAILSAVQAGSSPRIGPSP